jgi:hypothetical protein
LRPLFNLVFRNRQIEENCKSKDGCLRVAWAHYSFKVAWVFADTWKNVDEVIVHVFFIIYKHNSSLKIQDMAARLSRYAIS